MDCSLPGSSVHGLFRQEYWSGLPFLSPGDLPDSGIEPMSPVLADRFFTTEPAGQPNARWPNPNKKKTAVVLGHLNLDIVGYCPCQISPD